MSRIRERVLNLVSAQYTTARPRRCLHGYFENELPPVLNFPRKD
ncbi:hypothetical protein [Dyella lipolytica]